MSKAKYNTLLSLGYDANGRQIRKRITAKTKTDFDKKIFDAKKEFELTKNPTNIKFKDYAAKYVDVYKSMKSKRTYDDAKIMLNKFYLIDNFELKKIKQTDLQQIINDNKEFPRTCQLMRGLLKQIFDAAIDDGIIVRSPAVKLSLPKYIKNEKRALSINETIAVKNVQLEPLYSFFLKTIYYFGLRPGEALGLMKSDFNFDKKELTISRSLAFDKNNGYIKPTKTYAIRILPIPDVQIHPLMSFLSTVDNLYVFTENGALFTKSKYRYMWKIIKKEINKEMGGDHNLDLVHDLTPYIFRHNYATLLYYSNISIKQAAKLMGHNDTAMIMKVYAHIDESKENVREKLNEIMSNSDQKKSSKKVLIG